MKCKKNLDAESGGIPIKTITIYTDGACSGNPGPGGWGAVLLYKTARRELSGGERETTNNRMELTAAIRALGVLREACHVELYSDSRYLVDSMSKGWAQSWKARGWKRADKSPALNPDLFEQLLALCAQHEVVFHWVKGHADNPENECCDALARAEIEKFRE